MSRHAVPIYHFTEEDRPAISELRHPIAELMPGIGHGEWLRAFRHTVASENRNALGRGQWFRIKAQMLSQRFIQADKLRCAHRRWCESCEKPVR